MIKFTKIVIVGILAYCASMVQFAWGNNADFNDGFVYVHTSRNMPELQMQGKKDTLKVGTLLNAKNLEIDCGENQIAFLIFSNRTVIQLEKNTKIKIKSFSQTPPFSFDFYSETEETRSILDMEILHGKIRVYGARPRATSSINIESPFGKYDIKSTKFTMSVSDKHTEIVLFEGQSTFIAKNGKRDFIQNKQRGEISAERLQSEYPMKIEYLTSIEEDTLLLKYNNCKTVFNSVEFFKGKDGKIRAIRITPKEFLNRSAKYEYRK